MEYPSLKIHKLNRTLQNFKSSHTVSSDVLALPDVDSFSMQIA